MTPIILAAHLNNYEIVKLLLDRGYTVPNPHDARCGCDECVRRAADDSLQYSRSRINAYRALASPSLIALSSRDPILTAFELSVELKRLSRLENEFKVSNTRFVQGRLEPAASRGNRWRGVFTFFRCFPPFSLLRCPNS